MAFIEKLDGSALNLSPEEFEAYMQGRLAAPRGPVVSEGKRKARETREQLEELGSRQEKVAQGVHALQDQLQQWVQSVQAQVDEVTALSTPTQTDEVMAYLVPMQVDEVTASSMPVQTDEVTAHSVLAQVNEVMALSVPVQVDDFAV